MTPGLQTKPDRQWSIIFVAIFAMLIVQASRLSNHWTIWGVVLEGSITLLGIYGLSRHLRNLDAGTAQHQISYSLGLIAQILLPIITQLVIRPFSIGDPNELVLLNIVQNIAVLLAVIPYSRKTLQISSLLSSFLVLFVTAMTEHRLIWVLSAIFGAVGLWSLMCSYWGRLEKKFVTSTQRILPFRPVAISLALLMAIGMLAFASVKRSGRNIVLPGFMPTSGGDKMEGEYARSGVGNGDMLIAAEDSVYTFGPVDSKIFLESKTPSLYDVASDQYGEARKAKKKGNDFTPAISITADRFRQNHQKRVNSEQASRQFSTVRRFSKQKSVKADAQSSTALFQVAGPTPLHLATERFDTFDGVNWSHSGRLTRPRSTSLKAIGDKPWFQIDHAEETILRGKQSHTLRIINLKSKTIPSPSHLAGIHIADMNRPEFYRQADDGLFQLSPLEQIPRLTVIHLVSKILSHDGLIARGDFRTLDSTPPESGATNIRSSSQIETIARRWTTNTSPGWEQVSSLVETLRNNFTHDRRATSPEDCDNIVEHFLATRRGPDYMFASTAAQMLRSLGYETQVTLGFYANPKDYDAKSQHTIIGEDSLHFWTEVHVGNGLWIPIEPTPGYSHPRSWMSWQRRLTLAISNAIKWFAAQWKLGVIAIMAAVFILLARHRLLDLGSFVLWRAGWSGTARRRIIWTVRILEFRARMAGQRRPCHTTIPKWYFSLAEKQPLLGQDLATLETVLALADRAIYTPTTSPNAAILLNRSNIYRLCCNLLRVWTTHRMKRSGTNAKQVELPGVNV